MISSVRQMSGSACGWFRGVGDGGGELASMCDCDEFYPALRCDQFCAANVREHMLLVSDLCSCSVGG